MNGRYKLAKVANGVCHFAEIKIEILETNIEADVDISTIISVDSSWISAAKKGVKDALAYINKSDCCLSEIQKLDGTLSDTTEDVVWLASVLASMNALNVDSNVLYFSILEGYCSIDMKDGVVLSSFSK